MKIAKKLFYQLPIKLQENIISIYISNNNKRRYGDFFKKIEKTLKNNLLLSNNELLKFQENKLSFFLKNSSKSKFWKDKFLEHNVNINGDPFSEIKKLPILTKKEVIENYGDIIIHSSSNKKRSTSGSTGSGLTLIGDEQFDSTQWAIWWRYWNQFGIERESTLCAIFNGKVIVPPLISNPPFYRRNINSKQIFFSSYHLSKKNIFNYIDALNKYRPPWIHGFPSVISELCRLALEQDLKLSYFPQYVSFGAENVTDTHTRLVKKFFKIDPIQHYGLAEGVANFSMRPGKPYLYVDEDFSYVEFIPTDIDNQYKIIGTNFSNLSFPLIRYDTSDLAYKVNPHIFPRSIERIDGRSEDVITLPNGNKIGRLANIFGEINEVDEAQIYQKRDKSITVRLVINKKWKSNSQEHIEKTIREKLGYDVTIRFEYLDKIERTKSGKLRFVITEK